MRRRLHCFSPVVLLAAFLQTAAAQTGYTLPSPVANITVYPYNQVGLIANTNFESGSGAVINPLVVLSCGHLFYDVNGLFDLAGSRWYLGYGSEFFPNFSVNNNQVVLSGGIAFRRVWSYTGDKGYGAMVAQNGMEAPESFNLDITASQAYQNLSGGITPSLTFVNDGSQLLSSTALKIIVGYPASLYGGVVLPLNSPHTYEMHSSAPSPSTLSAVQPDTPAYWQVDAATVSDSTMIAAPGNSGGPVFVQNSGGTYTVAGVLVSGTQEISLGFGAFAGLAGVRILTPDVFTSLINPAIAQAGGTNPTDPSIASITTAAGVVGQPFFFQVVSTPSATSYTASGLPSGLSISATSGLITGTPTKAQTTPVQVGAVTSIGTATGTLTITITQSAAGAPVITSSLTATGTVGQAFTYQITASPAATSFGATNLPDGLTLDTATGMISGTPTAAAVSSVVLSATNASGTGQATLVLTISAGSMPTNPIVSGSGSSPPSYQGIVFQGNTYDLVLMNGQTLTVLANSGHITRVSYLDLDGDIVFVEFSGAGNLTISLDNFSLSTPPYYNQALTYAQGLATIKVSGNSYSTYLSIYTLGTDPTRIDPSLILPNPGFNGLANIKLVSIPLGQMGGINAGNAVFSGSSGDVGLNAFVPTSNYAAIGDIHASGTARPVLISAALQMGVVGGNLSQPNFKKIYTYGFNLIQLSAGVTSTGVVLPIQYFSPSVFLSYPGTIN